MVTGHTCDLLKGLFVCEEKTSLEEIDSVINYPNLQFCIKLFGDACVTVVIIVRQQFEFVHHLPVILVGDQNWRLRLGVWVSITKACELEDKTAFDLL